MLFRSDAACSARHRHLARLADREHLRAIDHERGIVDRRTALAVDQPGALVGNDTLRGGLGDDLLVGDFGLFIVPIVIQLPSADSIHAWSYQGSDWFQQNLRGGHGWFDHNWFDGHGWLDDNWFNHDNDLDWFRHHSEWFEFTLYEFLGRSHNRFNWEEMGRRFFKKLFDFNHFDRQARFEEHRDLSLAVGNDTMAGGEGDDVMAGDNLALVLPYGPVSSAPAGGTQAPYFLGNLRAGYGFILLDPAHPGRLDALVGETNIGGRGNSVIRGQQGRDAMDGGPGNDQLYGGTKIGRAHV